MKRECVLALALALSACGGGGGNQKGATPVAGAAEPVAAAPAAGTRVSVAPSSLALSVYENIPDVFPLTFKASNPPEGLMHVQIVERKGVLEEPGAVSVAGSEYTVYLRTAPTLKAGTYETQLDIRVCADDAEVCLAPLAGSPFRIPLTLTVKGGAGAVPLAPIAGLGAWNGVLGNATNNAYVRAGFDPKAFSMRWSLGSAAGRPPVPYAIGDGVVASIATRSESGKTLYDLVGIAEDSGKALYRTRLDGVTAVATWPSIAGGKIYMAVDKEVLPSRSRTEWQLYDLKTGGMLSTVPAPFIPDDPIFAGDGIFTSSSDAILRYDPSDFSAQWMRQNAIARYTTPAIDGDYVYTAWENVVRGYDPGSGVERFVIPDLVGGGAGDAFSIVLADKLLAVRGSNGKVSVFDLGKRSALWAGAAMSVPVIANGVLYTMVRGRIDAYTNLNAYDVATGKLLWEYDDLPKTSTLLVSDNLVFIGSDSRTIAIDLASHQKVWTVAQGGRLMLSDRGVLYIVNGTTVAAFNLR